MASYRAVFHLNEDADARIGMVLNNIQNLLDNLGAENTQVELVANGTGVNALLKANPLYAERVAQLHQAGVRFAACLHSMEQLKLKQTALLEGVQAVPSGVAELVWRQNEGWAYIRP